MNEQLSPIREQKPDNTLHLSDISCYELEQSDLVLIPNNYRPFTPHVEKAPEIQLRQLELSEKSINESYLPSLIKKSQNFRNDRIENAVSVSINKARKDNQSIKSLSQSVNSLGMTHMLNQPSLQPESSYIKHKDLISVRIQPNEQLDFNSAEQQFAEAVFQSKSFNSDLALQPPSIFTVEKTSDGKIVPPAQRKAVDNQKLYLQKYATYVNLPSIYVLDSQINNKFPDYCIQLAKCVLPGEEDYLVKTHYINGTSRVNNFQQIEKNYSTGLILRLLYKTQSQLISVKEIIIDGVWNALIKFSECGNFFCMIIPNDPKNQVQQQLRFCRLQKNQGVKDIIDQIENKIYKVHYPNHPPPQSEDGIQILGSFVSEPVSKQDWSFITHIVFDQNLRFIIGYGKQKFMMYNISKNESKIYEINKELYSSIHDIQFRSTSDTEYQCVLAVKRNIIYQIAVFDFFAKEGDNTIKLFLNFMIQSSEQLRVKISRDFKAVIFTDMNEKFIVEQKDGYTIQRKLNMLTGKIVHFIHESIAEPSQFYFVQTKDFDESVKISHSNREKKIFKLKRNIEPGILKVFDFSIQISENSQNGFIKKEYRMIGMQDEDYIMNHIKMEEIPIDVENATKQIFAYKNQNISTYIFSQMRAQSTGWPYFAYSGFSNYLLLINAFNRKYIERIQLALEHESITICDSCITDTYDLFILILSQDKYKLYMIDLDRANPNEMDFSAKSLSFQSSPYSISEPVFEYSAKDVDNRTILGIHARGSSRKEIQDRNEKQFVYFLHLGALYYWVKLNEKSKFDPIKQVCYTSSRHFNLLQDGIFILLQEDLSPQGKLVEQRIVRLQTNFSQFVQTVTMKRNSNARDKIIAMLIDQIANIILFVTQTKQLTTECDITIIKMKLYDLNTNKQSFEIQLTNEHIIGRLVSGLCTLINGHIYFNNNLIKIRYDLINSENRVYKFDESQIFDCHSKIFDLKPGIKIRSRTPLQSIRYHRMVYIYRDSNNIEPQQIMICPFLHEKRVYLNRQKINTYYFYSSIDVPFSEIERYNTELKQSLDQKLSLESKNFEDAKLKAYQKMRENKVVDKTMTANDVDSQISIVCINLSESKYYMYGTDGILQYRVSYEELEEQYGPIIKTSANGQYFIFKKSVHDISKLDFLSDEQIIERYMTIDVMKLSIFSFKYVKTINLYKNIKEWLLLQNEKKSLKELDWLYQIKGNSMNEIDIQIVINDDMDVVVRISKKYPMQYDQNGQRFSRHDIEINIPDHKTDFAEIFYFENGLYDGDNKLPTTSRLDQEMTQQSIFITNSHGGYGFQINKCNFFLWDDNEILYCWLRDGISNLQKYTRVNFSQNNIEKVSYFKDLRTSSDPNTFVFIVQQKPGTNSIFTWFVKENTEAEAYDVSEEFELIWDKLGNLQIITDGMVIFNKQRCHMTTYDYQDLFKKYHNQELPFGILDNKQGHRFDYKNHNWMIYKEYISLSFSYITFMILSKLEMKDVQTIKNYFDPVAYDYIFNKSTSFLDGTFVSKDSNQLDRVLQNFEEINPNLFELLIYNQYMVLATPDLKHPGKYIHTPAGSNTPLYKAVRVNNNRSVDIILKYMTKIKYNSSRNFMNVFPQLVNYQNFMMYIENLPIQTALMQQKQVLRVTNTYNNAIVKICESACVNVDDHFYSKSMEEMEVDSTNYKSYPVKVVAFRFAWLLLNPEGKMFLEQVFKNENLAYYRISTLQMIIEFLYLKYKDVLLTKLLPAFVIQSMLFQANVYTFEGYYELYRDSEYQDENGVTLYVGSIKLLPYKICAFTLLTANLVMGLVLIYFQYLLIKNMGVAYFARFYSLVDIAYIMFNVIIFFFQFQQLATDHQSATFEQFKDFTSVQRSLEAICILLIYIKAGYFLSLIDSIAPLMDNISQVLASIQSFTFLLVMYIFAFSQCFYILGKNQLYFDEISDIEMKTVGVPYDSFGRSIWYVYFNYMMGGKFNKSFSLGEGSQKGFLFVLFIMASTYIDIILLKMLIAIMGSTFASRKLVANEIKIKDHLRFLLDNWHLMDYALKDKSQVTYIISAFLVQGNNQQQDALQDLKEEIRQMEIQNQDNFKKLQYDINQVYLINQRNDKKD